MGLTDLFEVSGGGYALHVSDKAREMAYEVWIQLEIAMASSFDP